MPEFVLFESYTWFLPVTAVVLLLAWLLYRVLFRRRSKLELVLDEISFERTESLIIANADEGEILIDRLLLTAQGLLILDIKDVDGTVFGGDRMQDWTVISEQRRYTFPNPQTGLYDRMAAVREIIPECPVTGRVLFLDGAEFTKGVPELVLTLEELSEEFRRADGAGADGFRPDWEKLLQSAR